jgi:hypothetical protein
MQVQQLMFADVGNGQDRVSGLQTKATWFFVWIVPGC